MVGVQKRSCFLLLEVQRRGRAVCTLTGSEVSFNPLYVEAEQKHSECLISSTDHLADYWRSFKVIVFSLSQKEPERTSMKNQLNPKNK